MAKRVTREQLETPYLRVMLYGPPGSTKTRTAGTAALDERTYPCLWLNLAGNPESIRSYERLPDIINIGALKEFNPIYEWLATGQKESHPVVKDMELNPPYKSLVIDGITETQRQSFKAVMGIKNPGPGDILPTAEIQHFNKVLGQMVNFANLFYSLPMHVIITSLEREDKDKITGAIKLKPLLWGQSAGEVPGYALSVGRMVHRAVVDNRIKRAMEIAEDPIGEDIQSVVLWKPSGKYIAKDQTGSLGPWMQDPTVTKMLDLIMAGN